MLPRWTVITIGSITRNKFWGERDEKSYRSIYCTSTLIKNDNDIIMVDPSMEGEKMAEMLDFRCGLTPDKITKVFVTHRHGDHCAGLSCFPNAQWFMMPKELESGAADKEFKADRFTAAGEEISPGIHTIKLPGHTPGLGGLWFDAAEGRAVVTGDGVMTRDFFRRRMGYYNSADFEQASASIEKLIEFADVIVPGHDNYFMVKAAMADPEQEIVYSK